MLYLNRRNHHTLRKELRVTFEQTDLSLTVMRDDIRNLLRNGEHKLTTVIPYIKEIAKDSIESLTIQDLVKENDLKLS